MMNKLAFLNKVVIKNDKQVSSKATTTKRPAEGADLRVYFNGSVYPSEQLVQLFNLEYNKDKTGNGLDVFDGSKYHGFHSEENIIMIAAVPRGKGRGADIFKSCEFDADGKPKSSVLTQGATTFGQKAFIPMLENIYGIKIDKDEKPYVDLKIVGHGDDYNMPFVNSNGSDVYYVPKQIAAGPDVGNWTTVRREKLLLWALVPFEMVAELEAPIVLSGPTYREDVPGEATEDQASELVTDDMVSEAFEPDEQPEEELEETFEDEVPEVNTEVEEPAGIEEPEEETPAPVPVPKTPAIKKAAPAPIPQTAPVVEEEEEPAPLPKPKPTLKANLAKAAAVKA